MEPQPDFPIPTERVSQTLKRARQLHGVDLRTVAAILKIRDSHLDAIETGRYDSLPGPTYAVGFVRAYADYLGLDSEAVVRRFKQEVEGLNEGPMLSFPTPASEGRIPGGALILISALLIAVAYGVWYYLAEREQSVAELIQSVPERMQNFLDPATVEAPAPLPPGSGELAERSATPQEFIREDGSQAPINVIPPSPQSESPAAAPAPGRAADAQTGARGPAAPSGEEVDVPAPPSDLADSTSESGSQRALSEEAGEAQDVAEEPLPTTIISGQGTTTSSNAIPAPPARPAAGDVAGPSGETFGEPGDGARIVLRATQDSWVQVRDASDEIILARILRVGDSYRVPDQPGLTLLTGNAGGLQILVDGAPLAPLGPTGTVRRNVPLEPERLLQGYSTR